MLRKNDKCRLGFFQQPSANLTPPAKTFNRLIEYLSPQDKALIDTTYYPLMLVNKVATIINKAQWEKIGNINDFPMLALAALKQGKIDGISFSTSQIFYNVLTHPDNYKKTKIISIFSKNGQINPLAAYMIDETMAYASISREVFAIKEIGKLEEASLNRFLFDEQSKSFNYILNYSNNLRGEYDWTPQERNKFFDLLSFLPASERTFLHIPDHDFDAKEETLTRRINFDVLFNQLSRFLLNHEPRIMIPSKGMMQAYLYATRGPEAPRLRSQLSLCPWRGIYKGMKKNWRPLYIHFKPLAHLTPKIIDQHIAPLHSADAEKHDSYHGIRFADVPTPIRKLFIEIAHKLWPSLICSSPKDSSLTQLFLEQLAKAIMDMEHSFYDRKLLDKRYLAKIYEDDISEDNEGLAIIINEMQKSEEQPFWYNIMLAILNAKEKLSARPSLKDYSYHEFLLAASEGVGIFADILIENEARWHERYHFSLKSYFKHLQIPQKYKISNLMDVHFMEIGLHIKQRAEELTDNKPVTELMWLNKYSSCLYFRKHAEIKLKHKKCDQPQLIL